MFSVEFQEKCLQCNQSAKVQIVSFSEKKKEKKKKREEPLDSNSHVSKLQSLSLKSDFLHMSESFTSFSGHLTLVIHTYPDDTYRGALNPFQMNAF